MSRHVCPALLGRLVDRSEPQRAMRVSIAPPSPLVVDLPAGKRWVFSDIRVDKHLNTWATVRIEDTHEGVTNGQ